MVIPEILECNQLLKDKQLSLSLAESATAGHLSAALSLTPHVGDFLKGGIVCYDAKIKEQVLQVPHEMIERYTAESAEVTEAITKGVQKLIPADISIGITGLLKPGGSETPQKPVGTIFICLFHKNALTNERFYFKGNAEEIVQQTLSETGKQLCKFIHFKV